MTDQELAQAVHDRILQREAEAKAAGDKKRIVALAKFHKAMDKAWKDLAPTQGGIVPFSGGVKP